MNEKDKQAYLDRYKKEKEKGVPFFPDILFKDAVVSLVIFLVLVALAYFVGAELEAKANPSDSSYTPRPEWYFLFLFQLLKYFPGQLEVIGVVVLPTIMILLLFFLPFLDRGPKRHYRSRLLIVGFTLLLGIGVIWLSIQSVLETPPPVEAASGDQTALLYTRNCAACHGETVTVQPGTNLHDVIAQGSHEGMPAWTGDLSTDQIDALAGFILSPGGSALYTQACSECHQLGELVESDPLELKAALEESLNYPPHADIDPESWSGDLTPEEQTQLINFLIAPDGRRLFSIYCASCHGKSIAYTGNEDDLTTIINQGGLHLEMPAWQGTLSESEIDQLAAYVVDPSSNVEAAGLFEQNCASCHGDLVPRSDTVQDAKEIISTGGSHQTMPVWGDILTEEQINALVQYALTTTEGSTVEVGQELFDKNCTSCHGEFGEGGLNPSNPNDIIFPISTSEYLQTRDDFTLTSVITHGQPNYGMSPFGISSGGPLDDEQIAAIVSFLRSWEENPPFEIQPEFRAKTLSLSGREIYTDICAQCHGPNGEGGVGPAFADAGFQESKTDEDIFNSINKGHPGTSMIAWAGILTNEQIQSLIDFIRQMEYVTSDGAAVETSPEVTSTTPTYTNDVLPIFEDHCIACHGSMGGWDASTYDTAINSGNNGPVVIPGDAENSLLVQKLLGTQASGTIMPPAGMLPDSVIQIIIDWVDSDAVEK